MKNYTTYFFLLVLLLCSCGEDRTYQYLELTEENLLAVKGADKVVRRVVEKMTPSAVLEMIREGIHPLETSMEELDSFLSKRDTYAEDSEKYSRFLYNLEQNGAITEEEKAMVLAGNAKRLLGL